MAATAFLSPSPSALSLPCRRLRRPLSLVAPRHLLCTCSIVSSRSGDAAPSLAVGGGRKDGREVVQGDDEKFVEVGYITGAHGYKGEVRVVPRTGFPELRFCKPGKRWLRSRVASEESLKEVELISGRANPGKKGWLIRFKDIDCDEMARQIVGSTILVSNEDRPKLEDGEFYSRDLVGLRVVLKDTGELVGEVAGVFNFGANDLLKVARVSALSNSANQNASSSGSNSYMWIPFEQEIVPDVDLVRGELFITPPKGLLELNFRSDTRSKKERQLMEWKERKKLQQRLVALKKKLTEMDQKHILEGLKSGDKAQRNFLAKQIAGVDFRLLQHALYSIELPSLPGSVEVNSSKLLKNAVRVARQDFHDPEAGTLSEFSGDLQKGLELLNRSKAAIILIRNGNNCKETHQDLENEIQNILLRLSKLLKVEQNETELPIVIICPSNEIEPIRSCLFNQDYFLLKNEKVWVLEEQQLPIVSYLSTSNGRKILLNTPGEVLQGPTGCAGAFSHSSAHKITEAFAKIGVKYVQVCSWDERSASGNPLFFGMTASCRVDLGVKLPEGPLEEACDNFNVVLSVNHFTKLCNNIGKLKFRALPEQHMHIEWVDDRWVTIHPGDGPNSCRLCSDAYSLVETCSPGKSLVIEVVD